MSTASQLSEMSAQANKLKVKQLGESVVTSHGRALTFGVSKDRTKQILETFAARKYGEVDTSMLERKAARLKRDEPRPQ